MSTDKQDIRFLFAVSSPGNGLLPELTLHPVQVQEDGTIRNPDQRHPLHDFQISALVDSKQDFRGGTFGHSHEFANAYRVDLPTAERMVKVLRKIERQLASLNETLGYVETFADYATRVAHAAGASRVHKRFGMKVSDGGDWSYDGNVYHWGDAFDLGTWVADAVAAGQKVA